METTHFGDWLRRSQMRVKVLADLLGVSRQTVYTWIKGTHTPSPEHTAALRTLGFKPTDSSYSSYHSNNRGPQHAVTDAEQEKRLQRSEDET